MDATVPAGSTHADLHAASPVDAARTAERRLRDAGLKVTRSRRAILVVLAGDAAHLSADRVAQLLGEGVHRATVYRTLELFAEVGIVSRMHVVSGAAVYHLAVREHGHLHARCRSCGAVAALAPDVLADAVRHAAADGFRLEPAQSTLIGQCAACAGVR